jgi:hypothetical protein
MLISGAWAIREQAIAEMSKNIIAQTFKKSRLISIILILSLIILRKGDQAIRQSRMR